jgi:hypothetical protein
MTTNADEPFAVNFDWHHCCSCGDHVPAARWHLGHHLCKPCGDDHARDARRSWTVAPMHKSNYMLITNTDDLVGLNNKGGLTK